jgi:hypothetical protein
LIEEIWKDIKGYDGFYQVSNYGNVKSLDRTIYKKDGNTEFRKGQLMQKVIDKDGYYVVGLRRPDKSKKSYRVNQLVALAFIDNPDNYDQTNHKDENRLNNYVYNLEWCTSKYNNNYGTRNEKLTTYDKSKRVVVFDKFGYYIGVYANLNEACQFYNLDKSLFRKNRVYTSYNEYILCYENNFDTVPEFIDPTKLVKKTTDYIVIYNVFTGALIKIYDDLILASLDLNTNIHMIRSRIKSKTPYKNFIIKKYKNKNDIANSIEITKYKKLFIVQYDKYMQVINVWNSAKEISNRLGYDNSAILKCCKQIRESAYGYIWRREYLVMNENVEVA